LAKSGQICQTLAKTKTRAPFDFANVWQKSLDFAKVWQNRAAARETGR